MFYLSQIDTIFFAPFEDFQMEVSDSRLDISTNSEGQSNIYMSESKFGC